jgi:hypothetical protein
MDPCLPGVLHVSWSNPAYPRPVATSFYWPTSHSAAVLVLRAGRSADLPWEVRRPWRIIGAALVNHIPRLCASA